VIDSGPREEKIIHNKVAKATKTNHGRSLVETVCLRGLCVLAVRFPVVAALPALRKIFFAFIRVHSRSPFACIRGFFLRFLCLFAAIPGSSSA
jgi:hypothetical protein